MGNRNLGNCFKRFLVYVLFMFRLKSVGYSVKGKLPLSTRFEVKKIGVIKKGRPSKKVKSSPVVNSEQIARQKQGAINLIKKGTQTVSSTVRNLNDQRKFVDSKRSSIYVEKKPSLIEKLKSKKSIYD